MDRNSNYLNMYGCGLIFFLLAILLCACNSDKNNSSEEVSFDSTNVFLDSVEVSSNDETYELLDPEKYLLPEVIDTGNIENGLNDRIFVNQDLWSSALQKLDTAKALDQSFMKSIKKLNTPKAKDSEQGFYDRDKMFVTSVVPKAIVLNVCFADLTDAQLTNNKTILSKIEMYAKDWSKYGNVQFKFNYSSKCSVSDLTPSRGNLTIRIATKDPTLKNSFWSYIGNDILVKNGVTMSLHNVLNFQIDDAKNRRYIIHEFGHALGITHEHQSFLFKCRIDTIAAARYFQTSNLTDYLPLELRHPGVTHYDRFSIMHYELPKTIFTNCSESFPLNLTISKGDSETVATMYPFTKTEAYLTRVEEIRDMKAVSTMLQKKEESLANISERQTYKTLRLDLASKIRKTERNISLFEKNNKELINSLR